MLRVPWKRLGRRMNTPSLKFLNSWDSLLLSPVLCASIDHLCQDRQMPPATKAEMEQILGAGDEQKNGKCMIFRLQQMNICRDKVFDVITEVHLKESRLCYVNFLFALYKMHLIISCYLLLFQLICHIYCCSNQNNSLISCVMHAIVGQNRKATPSILTMHVFYLLL